MNLFCPFPIDKLQSFLEGALDSRLHVSLLDHLDQCETCRKRLEENAGSADDWHTAQIALSSPEVNPIQCIEDDTSLFKSPSNRALIDPLALIQMLAPSDDPRAAGRLGSFEITGIIGSGGMGIVLKARDPALDRFVAIKMLAPHLAKSQSARKRFAREARAAAAVIHDNVIAIYQVADWNELPYLVMPYLPDPSLQQRIDEHGKLELECVLSIGMQVARGLAAAHSQGLVHRDVKPANVLLAKGTERAIITDFGLARAADDASVTRIGMLAGTPHYMSPEQARGDPVDQKSDLYSLGSLLFAMFTGHPPIANELGSETIQRIARGTIPSLRLHSTNAPGWFIKLVDWLHQSKPDGRPESAIVVSEWLEQCLAHLRQPETHHLPECLLNEADVHSIWQSRFRQVPAITLFIAILVLVKLASDRFGGNESFDVLTSPNQHFDSPIPPFQATQLNWLGDEDAIALLAIEAVTLQERFELSGTIEHSPSEQEN